MRGLWPRRGDAGKHFRQETDSYADRIIAGSPKGPLLVSAAIAERALDFDRLIRIGWPGMLLDATLRADRRQCLATLFVNSLMLTVAQTTTVEEIRPDPVTPRCSWFFTRSFYQCLPSYGSSRLRFGTPHGPRTSSLAHLSARTRVTRKPW